jgi:uncharacterized protein YqgV (UPF0045/DUF77 family)
MAAPGKSKDISVQISVYPLGTDDLTPGIGAFLLVLRRRGIRYEFGPMSTVVTGEQDQVWDAVKEGWAAAADEGGRLVMTVTASNACPMPDED